MSDQTLRLATWNIHMAVGSDGVCDLGRTAAVIRELNPHLIGLQEVANQSERKDSSLRALEERVEMRAIPGPTMQRDDGEYGNALLTRLPVLRVERYDLSVEPFEPRGLLIVHQEWRGETVQIAVTHLGLRAAERRIQVRRLLEYLAAEERRLLILMGDFNEWLNWGRPLRWLRRRFGHTRSPATFPARWPLFRLDRIFADPAAGLAAVASGESRLAGQASDHLPLVAGYHC